jgi:hypothetical protein
MPTFEVELTDQQEVLDKWSAFRYRTRCEMRMQRKTPNITVDSRMTREQVEAILEEKLKSYRTVVYAFSLGLTCLIIVLVANQLVAKRSLLVYLHDQLFGSDRMLSEIIDRSVALSYTDQFAVRAQDKPHYLYFYASKRQKVVLLLDAQHTGTEHENKLLVTLDQIDPPLFDIALPQNFTKTEITTSRPAKGAPSAENVHYLSFQVDQRDVNPNDLIFVHVVANVYGLETKELENSEEVSKEPQAKEE